MARLVPMKSGTTKKRESVSKRRRANEVSQRGRKTDSGLNGFELGRVAFIKSPYAKKEG